MSKYNPYERFNQYRNMWVIVFFDLPTEKRSERKIAAGFRKKLITDGFTMFQFSIYTRFCLSAENAKAHSNRIKKLIPKKGKVCILQITDKQFGKMDIFHGRSTANDKYTAKQLELF